MILTLYKKRSDGKNQIWNVEQVGDRYRTISGIVDGKQVTSEWTVCKATNEGRANERNPEAQAEFEARAMYTKKKDSGYADTLTALASLDLFKPMLAKSYDDYKDYVAEQIALGNVYSQPKLNGIRCNYINGNAISRQHKQFHSVDHILNVLRTTPVEGILDGELYADQYVNDFNEICSIIKREELDHNDLEKSKSIFYNLYDYAIPGLSFIERYTKLKEFVESHNSPYLKLVPTTKVESIEHLDLLNNEYLNVGMEGQIIRINETYDNKRSKKLLKRKQFKDAEFTIVDVMEGVGNRSGTAGAMHLRDAEGREFDSNIKGTREYTRMLLRDKDKLIGLQATVKFFMYTPAGIPLFPFVITIRDYE